MTRRQRSTPTRPRRAVLAGSAQLTVGGALALAASRAGVCGRSPRRPLARPTREFPAHAPLPATALSSPPRCGAVEAGIVAVHTGHPIRVGRVGAAGAARTDATAGPDHPLRTPG